MKLKKYQEKRKFKETPEPNVRRAKKYTKGAFEFCVQKHDATRLHYDFRLEHKGVLLSWAVPKGPSMNPSDKRLAIHVEDHPFEYRTFEGVIPPGHYGAGTVEIWDKGTYTVPEASSREETEKRITEGLKKGHLEFELHGEKLRGQFTLIRLKKDDKSWLLIKKKDELTASSTKETTNDLTSLSKTKMPGFIKPMLATLVEKSFDDPDWLFEIKWDGYRALAYIEKGKVELLSRNDNSFNSIFPTLIAELKDLNVKAILDGEIVILDEKGRSNFQLMQNYQKSRKGALYYYVFDLLYLDGHDLRSLPLIKRKEHLKNLLDSFSLSRVRYSDHVEGKGVSLFKEATKNHLEGIIGKKVASSYVSKRSHEWVKIKTQMRQEAVIGGFTAPRGSRKKFGALLLGVYENDELVYIGHTGGGFDEQLLHDVYARMEPLAQEKCPFKKAPKPNASVTWIKPKLVCEISFSEWTAEGIARQPIFQGLRMDKKPKEIKKEMPEKAPRAISNNKKESWQFSNLDKIYWPKEKYTKRDLIEYYQAVSPFLLPYLKDRPVMLHRYPDGIEGEDFYQKDMSSFNLPKGTKTHTLRQEGRDVQYILIQNLATLEYVINLGAIELHPFLSRVNSLENPDFLLIDLDPVDISFDKVIEVALEVHSLLEKVKVKNYCKTSGGRGLHICIPLHKKYNFEQSKQFGQIIAAIIHQRLPSITSLERKPSKREKKIYLDVYQNNFGQTMVAPYTVRARPFAPVSTPLKWEELEKGLKPTDWTIETVIDRFKKTKDLFKPVLGAGVNLSAVLKKLDV